MNENFRIGPRMVQETIGIFLGYFGSPSDSFFLLLLHSRGGGGGGVGVWVCEYVSVNSITENLGTNFVNVSALGVA